MGQRALKGSTRDCFLFNSYLSPKKAAEEASYIDIDLIGMVKNNTNGFCKATIEGSIKDWPGGSCILLRSKPMVPGERPLLAIGYNYNERKVQQFVDTEREGSTKLGIPYLSKYPEQFTYVSIRPIACPLLMYKFFGSVNEGDSYNKSRQSYLALEKFWVTQCSWLCLCTTVAIGMKITNCWKLFCYGVKRYHYNKFIGIREFLEKIAVDCFNNNFTTDTWTPEKNIPSLGDIDKKTMCPPVIYLTILVLLLAIQRSARYWIS